MSAVRGTLAGGANSALLAAEGEIDLGGRVVASRLGVLRVDERLDIGVRVNGIHCRDIGHSLLVLCIPDR